MLSILLAQGISALAPTYKELQGPTPQAENQNNDINARVEDLNKSLETTGCMVMFDG